MASTLTPRDQAKAALFLASDWASHVTGEQSGVSVGIVFIH